MFKETLDILFLYSLKTYRIFADENKNELKKVIFW